ncbi:hypothetical protein [Bacteroides cellulosilyticus]|jgi:hypothetical protein|uniref:hypothetical protein n=2 Tax=Bacteroides cellulosilyticus TaxID=246787 RepID=UPI00374CBF57
MGMKIKLLLLTLLTVIPSLTYAQQDITTLEAYINDHKNVRSMLLARSTLELSNSLLHDYSKTAAVEYKELNVDLDKYTRAFDVIDVLYNSLRTSMNAYDTYNTVSTRIRDYKKLLEDYNEKVLKRGKYSITDTLIISVNYRMIDNIYKEGQELYKSLSDLVLYATGAAACSTSELMMVMSSINYSLDRIELYLNRAYFKTWQYVQLRMGYWKESIYRSKTRREILDGAFGRWREAGLLKY